jgi:hypothetical protein
MDAPGHGFWPAGSSRGAYCDVFAALGGLLASGYASARLLDAAEHARLELDGLVARACGGAESALLQPLPPARHTAAAHGLVALLPTIGEVLGMLAARPAGAPVSSV